MNHGDKLKEIYGEDYFSRIGKLNRGRKRGFALEGQDPKGKGSKGGKTTANRYFGKRHNLEEVTEEVYGDPTPELYGDADAN